MFKVGDIVKTRDGSEVEILCVNAPGRYPIIGMYLHDGYPSCWTHNGQFADDGAKRGADLLPSRRPQGDSEAVKYQVIAEHYDGGTNSWDFDTREEAEKWASGFQVCVTSIHEIKPTPPRRTRETRVWINVYPEGETFHSTEEGATGNAGSRALAVAVPVTVKAEW